MEHAQQEEWSARSLENPFAEAESATQPEALEAVAVGFAPWNENVSPFGEAAGGMAETDAQRLFAEAFAELRDESFDESLAFLAEETEQAVADRFAGETPASATERERFAESYLGGVRFEAEQYLQSLETGLQGMDVQSLSEEQLDEVLDRFDPQQPGELTPAGEEFIGKLIKKAKNVVKTVVKKVGSVAGKLLGPILKKLYGLVKPLLKRVLSFAVGKLPAALQPAARTLASKLFKEAGESEDFDEAEASPANLTDVEMLAESFDAAVAEAIASEPGSEVFQENFDTEDREDEGDGRQLERLAEARGQLIDRLGDAAEDEDLAPTIEQFVPALLGALRIGIRLVGRPKVVNFLAKFLAKLIGKWVGPQLAQPLSAAIVDTGLKLLTLEAESGERDEGEAAPVALASVIEDTVRKFAENEEYVFEDEGLMQLAASEALNHAVASNFPPRFVRPGLQQAPTLGGTFVARRPRRVRSFRKYSRVPEIEVTAQIADDLPSFGGTTVGAALRAAGVTFPFRARLHIYQSVSGTTLPRMVRMDRAVRGLGRGYVSAANVHPLTPASAGLLLREPKLGVDVPAQFMRSRQRIAAGQRFYLLEPMGASGTLAVPPGAISREAAQQSAPSRSWTVINLKRGRVTVGIYLSESDAQRAVQAVRQGKGALALLQTLADVYKNADRRAIAGATHVRIVREDLDEAEDFSLPGLGLLKGGITGALKKKLRSWVLSSLSKWARANAEAFARAAAHPDAGVTVRLKLTGVPGLDSLGQAAANVLKGGGLNAIRGALRASPNIAITMAPGKPKK